MASTKQTKHNPDLTCRAALTRPSGTLFFLREQRCAVRKAIAAKAAVKRDAMKGDSI